MLPVPTFIEESHREVRVSWAPPPLQTFKVNVDGSYRKSTNSAACGGLIRNSNGLLVKAFTCNLGFCNSI